MWWDQHNLCSQPKSSRPVCIGPKDTGEVPADFKRILPKLGMSCILEFRTFEITRRDQGFKGWESWEFQPLYAKCHPPACAEWIIPSAELRSNMGEWWMSAECRLLMPLNVIHTSLLSDWVTHGYISKSRICPTRTETTSPPHLNSWTRKVSWFPVWFSYLSVSGRCFSRELILLHDSQFSPVPSIKLESPVGT